jgi:hypothetical protein
MILFPFGSAWLKLSTLYDYIQGAQVGPQGAQTGTLPPKGTFFNPSRQILLAIWYCLAPSPKSYYMEHLHFRPEHSQL